MYTYVYLFVVMNAFQCARVRALVHKCARAVGAAAQHERATSICVSLWVYVYV